MRFLETNLPGAWLVVSEKLDDERGYFARMRCSREFAGQGIPAEFVQTNISFNRAAGTFRGLHFQIPPSREGKLVRCVAGAISDIVVDLRPHSPAFLRHQWFELSADNLDAVFVPTGCAHGFLTRTDDAKVIYEMSDYYAPELGRGLRWDDPALGIEMPAPIRQIHPRDADYPDLTPESLDVFAGEPA